MLNYAHMFASMACATMAVASVRAVGPVLHVTSPPARMNVHITGSVIKASAFAIQAIEGKTVQLDTLITGKYSTGR